MQHKHILFLSQLSETERLTVTNDVMKNDYDVLFNMLNDDFNGILFF